MSEISGSVDFDTLKYCMLFVFIIKISSLSPLSVRAGQPT